MFLFNQKRKQIRAVFGWLSEIVDRNDLILVEQEKKREGYFFRFPLKIGDNPEKIEQIGNKEFTFFIQFSSSRSEKIDTREWKKIFQSPEVAVYENKKRFVKQQFNPLRWGFSEEEKRASLKIARKSLEIFLEEKRTLQANDLDFPPRLNFKADLDVALWVKGVLRGSMIVENTILSEGIIQASIFASRDVRFKPLELDELENTKIEITIFSDLRIPLSKKLVEKNEILYNKGYLLKRGKKQGWFLPEVFNVASFKGLKEFLSCLALEKASLKLEEVFDKKTEVFIFEVDDFIEGKEEGEVLTLSGPMAQATHQEIKKVAVLSADWLLKRQESNGNLIPVTNPIIRRTSQIDWPRSIFTGWSLIEFGEAIGEKKYIEAGRQNFCYSKRYVLEEQIIKNINNESLSLAYLGQAALSLNYFQEAFQCGGKILEKENLLRFEPILFSQIGTFLAELSKIDKKFIIPTLRFSTKTQNVFKNYLRWKRPMSLAVWAELANLQLKLWESQKDDSHLSMAREILSWLLGYQMDNGSFRSTNDNHSDFAYTRGTAKIAEVLAAVLLWEKQNKIKIDKNLDLNYYEDCFKKALIWLDSMQYSAKNSYFIPAKNLDLALGGFRHDYFNQEAWIDSAGHFLLSASRFLKYFN